MSEWIILGRVIGTATSLDQEGSFVMQIYDFEPAEGVNLPASGCISFDFENGKAETYSDDGKVLSSHDIISALQDAKQK